VAPNITLTDQMLNGASPKQPRAFFTPRENQFGRSTYLFLDANRCHFDDCGLSL
jgi:hypothetical protein